MGAGAAAGPSRRRRGRQHPLRRGGLGRRERQRRRRRRRRKRRRRKGRRRRRGGGGERRRRERRRREQLRLFLFHPPLNAEDAEAARYDALRARFDAREAARVAALPPMPPAEQKQWREVADRLDSRVFDAVCAIHAALPALLEAKVPVPAWLEPADKWRAYWEPELEGFDAGLNQPRDPSILPTYHTGGVVGGTNSYPGPRSPGVLQAASRTALARGRKGGGGAGEALTTDSSDSALFGRDEMEEEERSRELSAFSDGAVQHEWSTWGDVELRAWNEKRRAHARADAAFAARQALVGRDKGFNVDEITDLRMARKVVGLLPRRFKLTWTHEEIMGVITNGGQNVHPDVAAPALGVADPSRNLDYWEEGIHYPRDFAADLAVAGVLANEDSGLPDLDELFAARGMDNGGGGGAGYDDDEEEEEEEGGGSGKSGVELADDEELAAVAGPSSSTAKSSSSKASKASRASTTLVPFPTAAATSADLAETFAGLGDDDDDDDEGVDVDDDEIVLGDDDDDDDDDGSGSDIEIGGLPGVDVDPEFDEDSV